MASTPSDKDRPNVSLTRAQVSDRLNAMSEALRGVVEGGQQATAPPPATSPEEPFARHAALLGCTADRNSRSDRFRSR